MSLYVLGIDVNGMMKPIVGAKSLAKIYCKSFICNFLTTK